MGFSNHRGIAVLLACFAAGTLASLSAPPSTPSAEEVLERMVQRGTEVEKQLKEQQLSYSKRSVTEMLSADGEVKNREEKLFEVLFKEGRVRMTLLELNGEETAASEERTGTGEVKPEDASEMRPPRGEERPLVLTKELVTRYQFELVEIVTLAQRECYVLMFEPKPGLHEEGLTDRFMNRLGGKLWVDQQDYEVARAELGLRSPVKILGGLIGAVNHFSYTLERIPVRPGLWFNRASHGRFELRKLLVSRQYRTQSEWQSFLTD